MKQLTTPPPSMLMHAQVLLSKGVSGEFMGSKTSQFSMEFPWNFPRKMIVGKYTKTQKIFPDPGGFSWVIQGCFWGDLGEFLGWIYQEKRGCIPTPNSTFRGVLGEFSGWIFPHIGPKSALFRSYGRLKKYPIPVSIELSPSAPGKTPRNSSLYFTP